MLDLGHFAPAQPNLDLSALNLEPSAPCDCLSCQTGRPDYPCLIEEDYAR